jgi:hypothetical protein
VSVRCPEKRTTKAERWGADGSVWWRISIEDPFETARDLGRVLTPTSHPTFPMELQRAYSMELCKGKSFRDVMSSHDDCASTGSDDNHNHERALSIRRSAMCTTCLSARSLHPASSLSQTLNGTVMLAIRRG